MVFIFGYWITVKYLIEWINWWNWIRIFQWFRLEGILFHFGEIRSEFRSILILKVEKNHVLNSGMPVWKLCNFIKHTNYLGAQKQIRDAKKCKKKLQTANFLINLGAYFDLYDYFVFIATSTVAKLWPIYF